MINYVTPFKVICLNDSNRPKQIPVEKWLTKDTEYTVIAVAFDFKLQAGVVGFVLKELPLGEDNFPYFYFNANRFAPVEPIVAEEILEEVEEFAV
jgi:hypothetical protein